MINLMQKLIPDFSAYYLENVEKLKKHFINDSKFNNTNFFFQFYFSARNSKYKNEDTKKIFNDLIFDNFSEKTKDMTTENIKSNIDIFRDYELEFNIISQT